MDVPTSSHRPGPPLQSGTWPFASFQGRIEFLSVDSLSKAVTSQFGQMAFWGAYTTSFGPCVLGWNSHALFHLSFTESIDTAQPPLATAKHPYFKNVQRDDIHASKIGRQIFSDTHATSDLRVLAIGTRFQIRVWRALLEIPSGKTVSYRDIALSIGMPTAVRAVGAACGANPLACVIPCHRVVGTSGSLTGYRWGVPLKQSLLAAEQIFKPTTSTAGIASHPTPFVLRYDSSAPTDLFSRPSSQTERQSEFTYSPISPTSIGLNLSTPSYLTCP